MIKIRILGYASDEVVDDLGFSFNKKSPDYIILFLGYAPKDIPKGKKIKGIIGQKKLFLVDLEIKAIHLGFAGLNNLIPSGYKSIVLFKGDKDEISELKSTLPKLTTWQLTDKKYYGYDALGVKVHNAINKGSLKPKAKSHLGSIKAVSGERKRRAFISFSGDTVSIAIIRGAHSKEITVIVHHGKTQAVESLDEKEIKEEVEKHFQS